MLQFARSIEYWVRRRGGQAERQQSEAHIRRGPVGPAEVCERTWRRSFPFVGAVSAAQFEANLALKRKQPDFRDDVGPILRPGFSWDIDTAMDAVLENLVALLPGDPWRGEEKATKK